MNIGVIFGGESCEHDISIITGEQLISKCNEYLYNIYPIYIDKQGNWLTGKKLVDLDNFEKGVKSSKKCTFLPNSKSLYVKNGSKYNKLVDLDMCFLCLHGARGEDGSVAGILELSKIPYSACSMCASSVCMDKCVFKTFLNGLGVECVPGFCIEENDYYLDKNSCLDKINNLEYPIILKPSRQGSSIGVEVCRSIDELDNKIKSAFRYDKKILVEKYVNIKKEVNIALFINKGEFVVSSTEEPVTSDEILSFDNKYRKNAGGFDTIKRIMPANLSIEDEIKIKDTAILVYKALEMFGIVRFDFIQDEFGKIFLNEVNTIPGSMANYLFDKEKYGYPVLIDMIISNAVHRCSEFDNVEKVFNTDVLDGGFDGFKK